MHIEGTASAQFSLFVSRRKPPVVQEAAPVKRPVGRPRKHPGMRQDALAVRMLSDQYLLVDAGQATSIVARWLEESNPNACPMLWLSHAAEVKSEVPVSAPQQNGDASEPPKKKLKRGRPPKPKPEGKADEPREPRGRAGAKSKGNVAHEAPEDAALFLYRVGDRVMGIAYYDGKVYPCKVCGAVVRLNGFGFLFSLPPPPPTPRSSQNIGCFAPQHRLYFQLNCFLSLSMGSSKQKCLHCHLNMHRFWGGSYETRGGTAAGTLPRYSCRTITSTTTGGTTSLTSGCPSPRSWALATRSTSGRPPTGTLHGGWVRFPIGTGFFFWGGRYIVWGLDSVPQQDGWGGGGGWGWGDV
jgi:hypothetical protein